MAPREQSATIQLKIRMKEPLRAALEKAAQERGVSLNSEAVKRLELSFEEQKRESLIAAQAAGGVYASFGGLDTFTIMRLLANVINSLEVTSKTSWRGDPKAFAVVRRACNSILELFRPGQELRISDSTLASGAAATEAEHLGSEVADRVMENWLEGIMQSEALAKALRSRGTPQS